jgi:serine/threonine-protein kinase
MEYFHSENLKVALWKFPERVYKYEFYVLRQVAEGLAYLHARGIVHRDMKPENILVNDGSECKLIDLSLAQDKWDRLNPFVRGRVEGTPLYMPPEQIRGQKVDARADIYSFGVVIYELLTKRPPFIGTTPQSILDKHLKLAPMPLRSHVKTIAPELEVMVLKMMEKDPAKRFQDMTSILYELSKWEKKTTLLRIRQVDPGKAVERPAPGAGFIPS